ncbi:MAG: isochorismatase family protein, partial [Clostridia bacterium]|nr:isochorismatase family protein [Clostridia bacterium]
YGLKNEQIEYLKNLNINQIDICGLQTDACVYAIAFQMFDNGIYPNILKNYCETNPQRNDIAKEILSHQFGKLNEKA